MASAPSFIAVIGHGPDLEREGGAAGILRNLGAQVRTLDLWDDPADLFREGDDEEMRPRAILVEAADRPDLASAALRSLKRQVGFEGVGSIIALTTAQVARLDPSSGFDDFVLMPFVPAELYARIRALEWRRSEFATEERLKIGEIVVDKAAREVVAQGRPVPSRPRSSPSRPSSAKGAARRFRASSSSRRCGGRATREDPAPWTSTCGACEPSWADDLPLETLRGAGYKLRAPADGEAEQYPETSLKPLVAISMGCPSGIGPRWHSRRRRRLPRLGACSWGSLGSSSAPGRLRASPAGVSSPCDDPRRDSSELPSPRPSGSSPPRRGRLSEGKKPLSAVRRRLRARRSSPGSTRPRSSSSKAPPTRS